MVLTSDLRGIGQIASFRHFWDGTGLQREDQLSSLELIRVTLR
jgi:hypothetical protein